MAGLYIKPGDAILHVKKVVDSRDKLGQADDAVM
jgi:hypothetical protein